MVDQQPQFTGRHNPPAPQEQGQSRSRPTWRILRRPFAQPPRAPEEERDVWTPDTAAAPPDAGTGWTPFSSVPPPDSGTGWIPYADAAAPGGIRRTSYDDDAPPPEAGWTPYDDAAPPPGVEAGWTPYADVPPPDTDTGWTPYDAAPLPDADTGWTPYDDVQPPDTDTSWTPYEDAQPPGPDTAWTPCDGAPSPDTDTGWTPYDGAPPDADTGWVPYDGAAPPDSGAAWTAYDDAPPPDSGTGWTPYQDAAAAQPVPAPLRLEADPPAQPSTLPARARPRRRRQFGLLLLATGAVLLAGVIFLQFASEGPAPAHVRQQAGSPPQPATAVGARAAAQQILNLYTTERYRAVYADLVPAVRSAVPEPAWTGVHQQCDIPLTEAPYTISGLEMAGRSAVVTITAGPVSATQVFFYISGKWQWAPSGQDLPVYHGSVATIVSKLQAAHYCRP